MVLAISSSGANHQLQWCWAAAPMVRDYRTQVKSRKMHHSLSL
ncbi:hypothetical protein [Prevotella histicola]|nr:hypothetical protein [Prevotella histicola]